MIEQLRRDLLAHPSATLTLERWCRKHSLAEPPIVRAVRQHDDAISADQIVRGHLAVDSATLVRHRRVWLMCGPLVLSEAENWYVAGRLPAAMNNLLDSTEMPFGKVAASLGFKRRTLSSTLLFEPGSRLPGHLFRNHAVLTRDDGDHRPPLPFAYLVETYRRDLLGQAATP